MQKNPNAEKFQYKKNPIMKKSYCRKKSNTKKTQSWKIPMQKNSNAEKKSKYNHSRLQ